MPRNNPPEMTADAREAGRMKALAVRQERAEIKRKIKHGELSPVDALKLDVVKSMHVYEFLKALPGVGYPTAKKIMARLRIDEKKRIGGLGSVQAVAFRDYIAEVVR